MSKSCSSQTKLSQVPFKMQHLSIITPDKRSDKPLDSFSPITQNRNPSFVPCSRPAVPIYLLSPHGAFSLQEKVVYSATTTTTSSFLCPTTTHSSGSGGLSIYLTTGAQRKDFLLHPWSACLDAADSNLSTILPTYCGGQVIPPSRR